jgi:hypothetical protein
MYPEAVEAIDAVGVKDVVVAGEPGVTVMRFVLARARGRLVMS